MSSSAGIHISLFAGQDLKACDKLHPQDELKAQYFSHKTEKKKWNFNIYHSLSLWFFSVQTCTSNQPHFWFVHLTIWLIFTCFKICMKKGFYRQLIGEGYSNSPLARQQNLKMLPSAQMRKELPLDFVRETSLPYLICMEKEETFW